MKEVQHVLIVGFMIAVCVWMHLDTNEIKDLKRRVLVVEAERRIDKEGGERYTTVPLEGLGKRYGAFLELLTMGEESEESSSPCCAETHDEKEPEVNDADAILLRSPFLVKTSGWYKVEMECTIGPSEPYVVFQKGGAK